MRNALKTSAATAALIAGAAAFIADHEGIRLSTYLDPAGIPTVCYGQTGAEARPGARYTREQCDAMLRHAIASKYLPRVLACAKRPMTLDQTIAAISFDYNTGAFCESTLLRKHNAGQCYGAALEFGRWVRAGGRVLPGLITRRGDEADLWRSSC